MRIASVAVAAGLLSFAAAPITSPRPIAASVALAATPAKTSASASPFALTASDGTGLNLVKMEARAVVDEPLAFTELVLTFENPSDRTLEGTFRITLPPGSAVSRFAMKVGELWQEGEIVALDLARRIYEDFLHRRQDPALLEQAAGNEFSARVFPIPAKGTKEIVVSWSQDLAASDAKYVLPLAGLPELGALDVRVHRPGQADSELHKTRYVPSKDFEVESSGKSRKAVRNGEHVIVRLTALEGGAPDALASALVLVDTSASRALGFEAQVALVEKLLAELGSRPVTIAAFDQTVELVYEGPAKDASLKKLRDRRALGASDLQSALKWSADHLRGARSGRERVILVTDGVATAGSIDGGELAAAVLALKKAGVQRMDAVVVGGIRDGDRLARLVTAGLAKDGIVADGSTLDAKSIAKKLGRATKSNVPVVVEDATWQWPTKLDGVQPGDEALVYATLAPGKPLRVKVGDRRVTIPPNETGVADSALLERACVRARIGSLLGDLDVKADGAEQKQKIREEIVTLSTQHRVLSPFTAMLVLETEEDFVSYGLDRKSLADVLTVGEKGVARIKRTDVILAEAIPVPEAETGDGEDEEGTSSLGVGSLDAEDGAGMEKKVLLEESAGFEDIAVGEAMPSGDPHPISAAGSSGLGLRGSGSGGGGSASGYGRGAAAQVTRSVSASVSSAAPAPSERRRADAQGLVSESDVALAEPPSEDEPTADWAGGDGRDPYEGKFAEVMKLLAEKKTKAAVSLSRGWHEEAPGDVMALVAYGTALEANGDLALAARAYGSIIDLFPMRADLRRFAGERLEHVGDKSALALAIDTFEKAAEQRPDHPASHRLLAFARVKRGEMKAAFDGLEKSLSQDLPIDRFDGADRILREDLALIGAAWEKAEPSRKLEIERRLTKVDATKETRPSLRFVLNWETDANDVDFHILDSKGGHAYYSQRELPDDGGELYADVTTGYGPECFTIRQPKAKRHGPYKLKAHYYSRGPMGYGMGKLQIIEHDGKGTLTFEERPFVVMVDEAYVDLGEVGGTTAAAPVR